MPLKRSVRATDSRHVSPIFSNLYRNLIPDRPDRAWVVDSSSPRLQNPREIRNPVCPESGLVRMVRCGPAHEIHSNRRAIVRAD